MVTKSPRIYDHAVRISEEYLGPAGERFIRRQISTHLGINPEDISEKDISKLVDWASIAFALLTSDTNEVHGFTQGLLSLSSNQGSKRLHGTTA
ncbi:MAG TPA: hypothetical protein VM124_02050 [Candidatus Limnocylindrales bacterium]|nr:hypothetical protein [Candidatus Limnocylindrales bacterium]